MITDISTDITLLRQLAVAVVCVSLMMTGCETTGDGSAPLAEAAAKLGNPRWGLLMRAGNDKSHMARQVERYADIYLSRVADFAAHTPFAYLRSARGSLPHDPSRIAPATGDLP